MIEMKCYICKQKITKNDDFTEIKKVKYSKNKDVYVHMKHKNVFELKTV